MQKSAKTLILSIVALVVAVCLLGGVVFAWFSTNTSTKVDTVELATTKGSEVDVALEIKHNADVLTDNQWNIANIRHGDVFTFTLTFTASKAATYRVEVNLRNLSGTLFDYKTVDSDIVATTNAGALYRMQLLSQGIAAGVESPIPLTLENPAQQVLGLTDWTVAESDLNNPDKKTVNTVVFTLTYGNWIGADESKMEIVPKNPSETNIAFKVGTVNVRCEV